MAKKVSVIAVDCASLSENRPCCNKAWIIGKPRIIKPMLEGNDKKRILRRVSRMIVRPCSSIPLETYSAMVGKAAVDIAIPMIPEAGPYRQYARHPSLPLLQ